MKKNYMKPCLLSETFVANNIMAEESEKFIASTGVDLYLNGRKFEGLNFGDGQKLQSISLSDFVK